MTDISIYLIYAVISFCIAAFLGPFVVPFLHRLKFGQEIREIGPSWHKKKSGTPTMGGFIFIIPVTVLSLIFICDKKIAFMLGFSLAFAAVGFADDFIKVILKRNLGLTERQKSFLQLVVGVLLTAIALKADIVDTNVYVPFVKEPINFGWFFVPFTIFVAVGGVNSVNLTDGIDGLAASVTAVVCVFFTVAAFRIGEKSVAFFMITNAAACTGFLLYNSHPAKIFMGDTGSLYLGAVVCLGAIVLKMPFALVIAGGVYVIETLSVIIQVTSFKLTGKRVFKMSPIHHHFEMCGWSEARIVITAVTVTAVLCCVAYAAMAVQ